METEPTIPAPKPAPKKSWRANWKILVVTVLLVVGLVAIISLHGKAAPADQTIETVTVAVAKLGREDLFKEYKLSAEFRPFTEVELHAKVSGYLEHINVDFGDQVKAGDLLATLEVPELQDELHNAVATEQKAQADYTNAHISYQRLMAAAHDHPNLIAQQDLDTGQSRDLSGAAAIAAAKADVEKYRTLAAYTKITAPFDGVITKRYADPGALIQAGTASETQSMPLVRLSDNYRLRLDFPVSVEYVPDIHVGDAVDVRVDSLGGRSFQGRISRFTRRVQEETRKMITEIEVENPKLELVPGMYAIAVLKVQRRPNALTIPSQAVSGDKETTVCVINADHQIEIRPVTLGLETPEKFEGPSGLKEGDLVMIGNRSLIHPGQRVETKIVDQLAVR